MRFWPVYGGGETITVTLANELVKRGHIVHILYTYFKDSSSMPYQLDSRIIQTNLYTIEKYSADDVFNLHTYLKKNKIDVMINQWGSINLCDEARKGTKTKLITCWHSDVIREEYPTSLKGKLLRLLLGSKNYQRYRAKIQLKRHNNYLEKSDKYVFLSKSFENYYRELSGLVGDVEKLDSISNPLTYNFKYDRTKIFEKKKQVLFVGRIYEYPKRVSFALRIWEKIEQDSRFSDWVFKIVGEGPDLIANQEYAKSLGLQRVSFEGFQNPRPYYDESSIFVMTSAFEGFGMTIVEAQQYGVVPIVYDTYKSLHDILINDVNGIIVKDNDLNCFAEKLKWLMSDNQARNRMAFAGLDSCAKFDVQAIVIQWESLIAKVVG